MRGFRALGGVLLLLAPGWAGSELASTLTVRVGGEEHARGKALFVTVANDHESDTDMAEAIALAKTFATPGDAAGG